MMEVIPALDIFKGKCVRLVKGNFKEKKIYHLNPLKVVKFFEKVGFKKLHLIDLEGAKEGKVKNWQTIKEIAKNSRLLIEFGGGIRKEKEIEKLFHLGINQVILGTFPLKEPEKFKNILKKIDRQKIIVAVDIKEGKICSYGWQKKEKIEINFFLKKLAKVGIKTVLVTDTERDGTLTGPNFFLYKKLTKNFPNLEIIASGGIRDIKDLKKLSKIKIKKAVIGKALYENKIFLKKLKVFL